MSGRPYSTFRVEALETMVSENPADKGLLTDVRAELQRRTTDKAKRLLVEVEQHMTATKARASAAGRIRTRHSPPSVSCPGRDIANATPGPVSLGVDARYELLRLTFTLEAEILAGWGMTEAMPREFQNIVFELWAATLADGADSFGRSPASLDEDLRRLQLERGGD